MTLLSIILPCYNEAGNIQECYRQLAGVLTATGRGYECIFVDDGSTDDTLMILKELADKDDHVKYLSFSRNFGHQQALRAGLDRAAGQIVIMMDSDLQHPPTMIPVMLALWEEGFDIVNTRRMDAVGTGLLKRATSVMFYCVFNFLTGMDMQPGMADFRLLDRKVVDALGLYHEQDLFMRGMIGRCGFRQTVVPYQAGERYKGESQYTLFRMLKLALDGITSFTIRPLRLAMLLAVFFAALSLIELVYVCYISLFTDRAVSGWASLAFLVTVLGAATLLMLGIIGEYVGRTFVQVKQRPPYIIACSSQEPRPAHTHQLSTV